MSRHYLILMLWLLAITGFNEAVAQPTPVLTCVSVSSGTDIEVSWDIPTGSFDGFRLFYGPQGGPYISADYAATFNSAIITVPNVSTIIYEFFLTTYTNSPVGQSAESNHLKSILLGISGDGTGIAELEWNLQGGSYTEYRLLRSMDNLNFQPLGTATSGEYADTISLLCDPTILYYIIEHGPCGARSNVVSGTFRDLTQPEDPVLKLVTIENGMTEVHWTPSPSADVDSIIIERRTTVWNVYRITGNDNVFIDNFTTDPDFIDPCSNVITYIVRAKDECDLESAGAINYLNPHNTLLLTGNTEELCDRKASLQWNAYVNMQPPVTHYKVERSTGGSALVDIADIAVANGPEYNFIDPAMLEPGVEVKYRISAVNSDNTLLSHSCELTLIPQPELITAFEISYVTVTDNTFITMNVQAEPVYLPEQIEIYRATEGEPQYLTTLPWDDSGVFSFEDHETSVGTTSYQYEVKILDACSLPLDSSSVFNSILLTIGVDDQENVALVWNNHIGWGAELLSYQVYKYLEGVLIEGYPKTVSPNLTDYNETVNPDEGLNTTYVVEAVHQDGRISRSNEVLLPRTPTIDVPTAFRPAGVNRLFRPLVKNIDQNAYLFMVYNRWGQLVFETRDPLEGWDGRINGDIQQGIYIYQVTYRDQTGTDAYKRGSVILLD